MPQIADFLLSADYSTSPDCGVFSLAPRRCCAPAPAATGKMPAMRIGLLALWHFMTAHFDTICWRWNICRQTHAHTHTHVPIDTQKPKSTKYPCTCAAQKVKPARDRKPPATSIVWPVFCYFRRDVNIWHWTRFSALLLVACRPCVECVDAMHVFLCM